MAEAIAKLPGAKDMISRVHNADRYGLRGLENDPSQDIIVRLDRAGFVVQASQNAKLLGIDVDALLVLPHVSDFADTEHQAMISRYFEQVTAGVCSNQSVEFPLRISATDEEILSGTNCEEADADLAHSSQSPRPYAPRPQAPPPQWYSLQLRRIDKDGDLSFGVLGTLRSVQVQYASAPRMPVGAISDPFTGLADRRCFVSSLIGRIAMNETVSVAVFAIDSMRAIFMRYGQGTADEIRWGFARFLEAMAEPHHNLAQIDEERFGIILPGMRPHEARKWAGDALQIFKGLAMPISGNEPELSASAGVARGEQSAEWTLRQAELGLVMARSGGGMQATICQSQSSFANARTVKLAMDAVVESSAGQLS